MTARCEAFIQIRSRVVRLENEGKKAEAKKARQELRELSKELTPAEQDWLKVYLADEAVN